MLYPIQLSKECSYEIKWLLWNYCLQLDAVIVHKMAEKHLNSFKIDWQLTETIENIAPNFEIGKNKLGV